MKSLADNPLDPPIEVVRTQPATAEVVEKAIEIIQEKVADQEPVPIITSTPAENVPVIVPVPEDDPIVVVTADPSVPEPVAELEKVQTVVAPAVAKVVQVPPPTAQRPVVVVKEEDTLDEENVKEAIVKQTVAALAPQAMPAIVLTAPSEDDMKANDKNRASIVPEEVAYGKLKCCHNFTVSF